MTGTALCKKPPASPRAPDRLTLTPPTSTFLKRKGGLFKKAHELSVLCSVDVAVIILSGNNNKLHQFSSMDMQEMLHRWGRVSHLVPPPRTRSRRGC